MRETCLMAYWSKECPVAAATNLQFPEKDSKPTYAEVIPEPDGTVNVVIGGGSASAGNGGGDGNTVHGASSGSGGGEATALANLMSSIAEEGAEAEQAAATVHGASSGGSGGEATALANQMSSIAEEGAEAEEAVEAEQAAATVHGSDGIVDNDIQKLTAAEVEAEEALADAAAADSPGDPNNGGSNSGDGNGGSNSGDGNGVAAADSSVAVNNSGSGGNSGGGNGGGNGGGGKKGGKGGGDGNGDDEPEEEDEGDDEPEAEDESKNVPQEEDESKNVSQEVRTIVDEALAQQVGAEEAAKVDDEDIQAVDDDQELQATQEAPPEQTPPQVPTFPAGTSDAEKIKQTYNATTSYPADCILCGKKYKSAESLFNHLINKGKSDHGIKVKEFQGCHLHTVGIQARNLSAANRRKEAAKKKAARKDDGETQNKAGDQQNVPTRAAAKQISLQAAAAAKRPPPPTTAAEDYPEWNHEDGIHTWTPLCAWIKTDANGMVVRPFETAGPVATVKQPEGSTTKKIRQEVTTSVSATSSASSAGPPPAIPAPPPADKSLDVASMLQQHLQHIGTSVRQAVAAQSELEFKFPVITIPASESAVINGYKPQDDEVDQEPQPTTSPAAPPAVRRRHQCPIQISERWKDESLFEVFRAGFRRKKSQSPQDEKPTGTVDTHIMNIQRLFSILDIEEGSWSLEQLFIGFYKANILDTLLKKPLMCVSKTWSRNMVTGMYMLGHHLKDRCRVAEQWNAVRMIETFTDGQLNTSRKHEQP